MGRPKSAFSRETTTSKRVSFFPDGKETTPEEENVATKKKFLGKVPRPVSAGVFRDQIRLNGFEFHRTPAVESVVDKLMGDRRQEYEKLNRILLLRLTNPWSSMKNSDILLSQQCLEEIKAEFPEISTVLHKTRPLSAPCKVSHSPKKDEFFRRLSTPKVVPKYSHLPPEFVPHLHTRLGAPDIEYLDKLAQPRRPYVPPVSDDVFFRKPVNRKSFRQLDPVVLSRLTKPKRVNDLVDKKNELQKSKVTKPVKKQLKKIDTKPIQDIPLPNTFETREKLPIEQAKHTEGSEKHVKISEINEKEAAVRIQSSFRGYVTRKRLSIIAPTETPKDKITKSDTNKSKNAATKIQASFRGYYTRKRISISYQAHKPTRDILEQQKAATVIQKFFRDSVERRDQKKSHEISSNITEDTKENDSTKNANNVSENLKPFGSLSTIEVPPGHVYSIGEMRDVAHSIDAKDVILPENAEIQDVSESNNIQNMNENSTDIDNMFSKVGIETKQENYQKNAINNAADPLTNNGSQELKDMTSLESDMPIMRNTKRYSEVYHPEEINLAATKVQSAYRGYRTRKSISGDGAKPSKKSYVIAVGQRIPENAKGSSNMISDYSISENSTGDSKRKSSLSKQDHAATKVQSTFRGYRTRKSISHDATAKKPELTSSVNAGHEQEDNAADLLKQDHAATKVQSTFRGYRTRKSLSHDSSSKKSHEISTANNDHEDEILGIISGAISELRASTALVNSQTP